MAGIALVKIDSFVFLSWHIAKKKKFVSLDLYEGFSPVPSNHLPLESIGF